MNQTSGLDWLFVYLFPNYLALLDARNLIPVPLGWKLPASLSNAFGTDKAEAVDIKFNSIKDANEGTPFSFDAQIDDASKALAGITTTNN